MGSFSLMAPGGAGQMESETDGQNNIDLDDISAPNDTSINISDTSINISDTSINPSDTIVNPNDTSANVYTRGFIKDRFNDLNFGTGTILIKFYSDSTCTQPVSVSNLNLNYNQVSTNCDATNAFTSTDSVICSGTQISLGTKMLWMEDDTSCISYDFSITNAAAYTTEQTQENVQVIRQRLDSLEWITMKDSLGINDSTITAIFFARDQYLSTVATTRSSDTLSLDQQDIRLQEVKAETENQFLQILGQEIYEKYVGLIRNNMNKNAARKGEPLIDDETP